MSAGTFIIKKALRTIGAYSIAASADPDSISEGMDYLNGMIQTWESKNIVMGATPLSVPGDELNEPADTTNAIIANLALLMAPTFDNGALSVVSPRLEGNAKSLFLDMKRAYSTAKAPRRIVSTTLPRGEGNREYITNKPFFDKDQVIGS